MSNVGKKVKDYLTVVKNGIRNRDKIIEAVSVATLVKNGEVTAEAMAEILRRQDICATCPYNSDNAPKHGIPIYEVGFTHCVLCTCRIQGEGAKEYCLSCTCGAEAWNKTHPENPVRVRWKPFDIKTNKPTDEEDITDPPVDSGVQPD